jgi:hypothetical protein
MRQASIPPQSAAKEITAAQQPAPMFVIVAAHHIFGRHRGGIIKHL